MVTEAKALNSYRRISISEFETHFYRAAQTVFQYPLPNILFVILHYFIYWITIKEALN